MSLAWGLWEQASDMTGRLEAADLSRLGRDGILAMSSEDAMALFDTALAVDEPLLPPARIDRGALRARHAQRRAAADVHRAGQRAGPPPRRRLARRSEVEIGAGATSARAAPNRSSRRRCSTWCGRTWRRCWATPSRRRSTADKAFHEHGFDSLTAVEMRNRLKTATGLALSPTLIFDYPTPAALADYIRHELAGAPQAAKQTPAVRVGGRRTRSPIVGMSCRYPGGVDSPEDLWDMVAEGRDVLSDFPTDRGWDLAGLYNPDPDVPGTCYTRTGGFVDGVGRLRRRASSGSRPARRWRWTLSSGCFLELSWEALERGRH